MTQRERTPLPNTAATPVGESNVALHFTKLDTSKPQPATTTTVSHKKTIPIRDEIFLAICIAGIFVFYLLYGIVQEQMNFVSYGEEKLIFGRFTAFLLTVQCLVNYLSAKVVQTATHEPVDNTPLREYGFSALLIVVSTFLSNTAIRYISYPTQVLAKSCKPIPVLLMGVALFMSPSTSKKESNLDPDMYIWGNILLIGSLCIDGVIGPSQENYVTKYRPTSNITIINGEFVPAIEAIIKYPQVLTPIFLFCITSALGQHFIFMTTNRFGALNCTTITTTRKFFSIFISIFWFGHPVGAVQWIAIFMVFFGLTLDVVQSYYKSNASKSSTKQE
eukprot:gene7793-9142_t